MTEPTQPPDEQPTTTVAEARAAIDQVIDHITTARRRLNQGHAVGLVLLEDLTRDACRIVAALPRQDRLDLRSLLEAILYDLDILAADLTDRYGALARRPDSGPGPRRAPPPTIGDAYRRDGLDRPDPDREET